MVSLFNLPRQGVFGLWLLPLWNINGFQGHHCHWMTGLEETIGTNGFSMVLDHRTIAIESMVLQSTIGDDGFSMVNEKKRQWFSKIAIYDKKLLLEFKLPTQIEIAQSYQEHHALLPHAMWTYICQNWDLNSSKWGPKFVKMGTHFEWNDDWQSFTSLVQFPCSMTERVQNF